MEKHAFFILIIIVAFAITGLLLVTTITGQSYRYAQQFGPQGQQPSYVNDFVFKLKLPFNEFPKPSSKAACCSFVKLGELGSIGCPLTQELFDKACTNAEGMYNFPPCPPNHLICYFPRGEE